MPFGRNISCIDSLNLQITHTYPHFPRTSGEGGVSDSGQSSSDWGGSTGLDVLKAVPHAAVASGLFTDQQVSVYMYN